MSNMPIRAALVALLRQNPDRLVGVHDVSQYLGREVSRGAVSIAVARLHPSMPIESKPGPKGGYRLRQMEHASCIMAERKGES